MASGKKIFPSKKDVRAFRDVPGCRSSRQPFCFGTWRGLASYCPILLRSDRFDGPVSELSHFFMRELKDCPQLIRLYSVKEVEHIG